MRKGFPHHTAHRGSARAPYTSPMTNMKIVRAAVALLLVCAGVPGFAADPPPTPATAPGVKVVSPEEARGLLAKAHVFDMRAAVSFGKGHLKGAKAFPYNGKSQNHESFDASLDQFDTSKLPADKSAPLLFYSDGPRGWKSYKAAVQAARAGWKDVSWMREGTAGWAAKGFPLE